MEILPVHSQYLYRQFCIYFPYPLIEGTHAVVSGAGTKSFILHGRVYFFTFRHYSGSLHRLGFRLLPALAQQERQEDEKRGCSMAAGFISYIPAAIYNTFDIMHPFILCGRQYRMVGFKYGIWMGSSPVYGILVSAYIDWNPSTASMYHYPDCIHNT